MKVINSLVAAGVCVLASLSSSQFSYAVMSPNPDHRVNTVNVILMISDGFGPASETFARSIQEYIKNNGDSFSEEESVLLADHDELMVELDEILVGQSRTKSSSSLITDSAAGATAFSCALKTYNAAIGVDPNRKPCGTVLEAAKAAGYKTGLVATSRITHATPASFSAHIVHRDLEDAIALHQIGEYPLGPTVDLMLGGGKCHFLPAAMPGSCRKDQRYVLEEARKNGYTILNSKEELDRYHRRNVEDDSLKGGEKVLGLFTPDHMSYEIDRDDKVEPSLHEMAHKAMAILEKMVKVDKAKGFFVMIEGSRIDMAGHNNDPAAHYHDIIEYQRTVKIVKDYVRRHAENTVLISVSDHETGGLTVGRQLDPLVYPDYLWYPGPILKVKNSVEYLVHQIQSRKAQSVEIDDLKNEIITKGLGITDPSHDEIKGFLQLASYDSSNQTATGQLTTLLMDMVSRRSQVGWTTHGHTGVDVNLYALGLNADSLRGSHENTDIGYFIAQTMKLDLAAITAKLRGTKTGEEQEVETQEHQSGDYHQHLKHYHYVPKQ